VKWELCCFGYWPVDVQGKVGDDYHLPRNDGHGDAMAEWRKICLCFIFFNGLVNVNLLYFVKICWNLLAGIA